MRESRLLVFISFSSTIAAPIFLSIIALKPHIYIFLAVLFFWFAYYIFIYARYDISKNQTVMQIMTALSFIILLILTEFSWLRWILILFSAVVFFFIAFWSEPRIDHGLYIKEKPLRRMMMMLYVFNVYALLLAIFALHIYFSFIPFFLLAFGASLYIGVASYFIWRLYYQVGRQEMFLWSLVLAVLIYETMWVFALLPFGYLVMGCIVTWMWYIMQLLVRFHLSNHRIVWKRQVHFLVFNALLFCIILYFIRWI